MKKCLHAAFWALWGEIWEKADFQRESQQKKIGFSQSFSVFGYQTLIFYGIPLYDAIMTEENSVEYSAIDSSAIHANLAILSHP